MSTMETRIDIGQEMRPWVSPSLIEANHILSLSRQELQEAIQIELFNNPALEMDEERDACPLCGGLLEGTFCPTCLISQRTEEGSTENFEDFPEQMATATVTREDGDEFDPMALVAAEEPVTEQILADARTILEPDEHPIVEYLVDALDERGFLNCDLDELARLTGRSIEEIEAIIEVIQDVAPVGVGARDLRECLLLQIRYLSQTGVTVPPAVERIIEEHLADFAAHKYGQIAKDLGLSAEEVEEAREFIRTYLNPFPLQASLAKSWRSPTDAAYVAPDVIISLKDDVLHVEVVDTRHFHLRLNSLYESLAGELGRRRATHREATNGAHDHPAGGDGHLNGQAHDCTDDEKQHVRQATNRAKIFIANVQQRRETLLRISLCLCELQENFLRGGVRELQPLTRAIVAQQVGVHESTVSRATAGKYVMLPSRRVIPFSDFFTPSLSIKDVMKELILHETAKGEPLTDRRICDLLLQQGIRIARRTVAKYRAELGILPSTLR
jgi:RNA polymerase sigma-54 factor